MKETKFKMPKQVKKNNKKIVRKDRQFNGQKKKTTEVIMTYKTQY